MAQPINPRKQNQIPASATSVPVSHRFVRCFIRFLLRHRIHFEIPLRRNPKRIGNTIEESKHRRDIHRLGNLRIRPSMIAKPLHVFRRRTVRRLGHLRHVFQQRAFSRAQVRFFQIAIGNPLYCLFIRSLNPQEVSMRIQSIGTAVQP